MAMFTPNPNAEAAAEFDVVAPGKYRLRVKEVGEPTESQAGNTYVPMQFEYADKGNLRKEDGTEARNPGNIFERSVLISPADKQGRLRAFVESCGKQWGEVTDLNELVGAEFDAKVKVERDKDGQYPDKNAVQAYLAPEYA